MATSQYYLSVLNDRVVVYLAYIYSFRLFLGHCHIECQVDDTIITDTRIILYLRVLVKQAESAATTTVTSMASTQLSACTYYIKLIEFSGQG